MDHSEKLTFLVWPCDRRRSDVAERTRVSFEGEGATVPQRRNGSPPPHRLHSPHQNQSLRPSSRHPHRRRFHGPRPLPRRSKLAPHFPGECRRHPVLSSRYASRSAPPTQPRRSSWQFSMLLPELATPQHRPGRQDAPDRRRKLRRMEYCIPWSSLNFLPMKAVVTYPALYGRSGPRDGKLAPDKLWRVRIMTPTKKPGGHLRGASLCEVSTAESYIPDRKVTTCYHHDQCCRQTTIPVTLLIKVKAPDDP